jgi:ABC-type sugar transport system substrate-binding protein
MKFIRNRRLVGTCLVLVVGLVGSSTTASHAAAKPKKLRIAFSPIALAVPALKGLSEGIKGVGAGQGWDVTVLDPNFDPAKQAQQLTQLITAKKIDAAWAISIKPGAMKQVARLAQKKKVGLILNGVPEDYGFTGLQKGLTFANIAYSKYGTEVGKAMAECVTTKMSGKAEIIVLPSSEGSAGKEETDKAMLAELTKVPGIKVVATEIVKDRPEAQTKVGQVLQAVPTANAVMATNDEGSLGALGAFAAANKPAPCVVGGGGNDEVLAAQKEGKMFAVVALQFEADLMQNIGELGRLMGSPGSQGKQLEVPLKVIK